MDWELYDMITAAVAENGAEVHRLIDLIAHAE
jgi:hypothetical protein